MLYKLSLPLFLFTLHTTAQSTTATAPLPTLSPDWFFIRAVEEPNYHSYLQSAPTETPGIAVLDTNTQAGQFNIVSGQLVYHLSGSTNGSLYMNVENPSDKTQRKLSTWFNTTENAYGEFAFQGDTVTWSVEDIDRPNTGAWLVCEDQQLFINTGSYGYETPEGCADETVSPLLLHQSFKC